MWRRLSAGKGAFSPELLNSYELVSTTEDDDSLNENHRLLTNGHRRQSASSGNHTYHPIRDSNNLISSADSNQNHYPKYRRRDSFEEYQDGVSEGDCWNQPAHSANSSSRKMLRRSSDRDTSRISSVDNPNYCSVNMGVNAEEVPDSSRTLPDNRRASSPYNVMSPADDSRRGNSNGCLRALSQLLRCTFW